VARSQDEGFVAVDALVALAILSATVALTLQTADVARRTATTAAQMRRAQALLEQVLDAESAPGSTSGQSEAFAWRVEVAALPLNPGQSQAMRLCRRAAQVTLEGGVSASAHVYRASTVRLCPRPDAGA
jgi:hypothetical protein